MLDSKFLSVTLAVEAQWSLGKTILQAQLTDKNKGEMAVKAQRLNENSLLQMQLTDNYEGEMSIEAYIYRSDDYCPHNLHFEQSRARHQPHELYQLILFII